MKIKYKFVSFLVLISFAGLFWTSCDTVDEPLVVTSDQIIPIIDDTVFVIDSILINQKQALLEDFTGHKCVYCCEASIISHEWIEDYDHKLIIYSVHAGYLAVPDETGHYTYDFRNPTSNEIFQYFNEPLNPTATINRVEFDGMLVMPFLLGQWDDAIENELAKENIIDLQIKNTYYPNKESVVIDVTSSFLTQLDGKYKIVVALVEDNIVAPQANNDEAIGPTPDWLDYVHHNVLRHGINGTFGGYVTQDGNVISGETYYNRFYYEITETEWVKENLKVVAYIYSEDTDEILQVGELAIKTE